MARHRLVLASLALVLVAGACSSPAPAPERDLWYSLGDGEARYGWLRTRVRALADGAREYRLDSRVELELFGAPQDQRAEIVALVDAELRPLELEARSELRSGAQLVRGWTAGDDFVVEAGGAEPRVVGARAALVLDLALGDWLHRRRESWRPGDPPREVALLAAQTGDVSRVRVRRAPEDGEGSRWELFAEGEATASTLELDAEGRLRSQRTGAPALLVQRAEADEALAIERRRLSDRELLVFTPPTPLPPAHRLASVTLRLRWGDIALAELELEDPRQRLVSHVEQGGRHEVVLELRRSNGAGMDATLPVSDERFAATLAESEFLRPKDERIAALARELVGEERSALGAARLLCAWVSANVEPVMIAETLSGPEVLERRVGKCTETTTLFGSLARAVGLPTRVALGLRRFPGESGDSWGGHMWNEVWVGAWLPVDAGADEVGGSPALVKLVASDTVEGTQRARWLLTESLELEVVAHELRPAAADDWTTGLAGRRYTDADEGLRFELPEGGWRVVPVEAPGVTMLRLEPPGGSAAKVHLVAFPLPAAAAPRAILAARQEAQAAQLEELALTEDRPQRVGALEGHRLRFEGRLRGKDERVRVTELLWTAPGRGFLLNLIAGPEEHDALAPALDEIPASFELATR